MLHAGCSASTSADSTQTATADAGHLLDASKDARANDASRDVGHDAPSASDGVDGGDANVYEDASMSSSGTSTVLFDGTMGADWKMSTITNQPGRDDPGHFTVDGGALVAHPGTDIGLLWNTTPTPPNFQLTLEWRLDAEDDNSGVFLRFPDLDSKNYDNTAYVAVDFGFEIQINEPGYPDGAPKHTTGAIYNEPNQSFSRVVANPPGAWNTYVIRVIGDDYSVSLNGAPVSHFVNTHPGRGLASPAYVGLQTHTGSVAFRNISVMALP